MNPLLMPHLETITFNKTIGLEDHFLPLEIRDFGKEFETLVKPLILKLIQKSSRLKIISFRFRFSGFEEVEVCVGIRISIIMYFFVSSG